MVKYHLTTNSFQTKKLGKTLAQDVLKQGPFKRAVVIGLIGDLGEGKTTFLQGFAKGLGIKEKILSPTFVLMKNFQFSCQTFFHLDCYRIQKPKEILDLGFKEIISNSNNIIAIEWADRIKKILPKKMIWVKFEIITKDARKITIKQNLLWIND